MGALPALLPALAPDGCSEHADDETSRGEDAADYGVERAEDSGALTDDCVSQN